MKLTFEKRLYACIRYKYIVREKYDIGVSEIDDGWVVRLWEGEIP